LASNVCEVRSDWRPPGARGPSGEYRGQRVHGDGSIPIPGCGPHRRPYRPSSVNKLASATVDNQLYGAYTVE
jgi:hypothetical protein